MKTTILKILVLVIFPVPMALAAGSATLQEITNLETKERSTIQKVEEIIQKPKLIYNSSGLRDPFIDILAEKRRQEREMERNKVPDRPRENVTVKSLPVVEVKGMIWGGPLAQAIINDTVVRVGDTIEDMRIMSIDKNGIKVMFKNTEHVIMSPAKKSLKDKEGSKGGKDAK